MNSELTKAVAKLMERAKTAGQSDKPAMAEAMTQLVKDMGDRIPCWYVELLVGYPLCGLEIGWQADEPGDNYDGIAWIQWSDPANTFGTLLWGLVTGTVVPD